MSLFKASGKFYFDIQCLKLWSVLGPPEPPGAPTLTVTNLTTLTLTWSAPWQHPISNYTVTVTNTSSSLVSQFTVYEEQFVLKNEGGAGEGRGGRGEVYCDELVFTVEAETDVGRSGTSLNATGNFPRCEHTPNMLMC